MYHVIHILDGIAFRIITTLLIKIYISYIVYHKCFGSHTFVGFPSDVCAFIVCLPRLTQVTWTIEDHYLDVLSIQNL